MLYLRLVYKDNQIGTYPLQVDLCGIKNILLNRIKFNLDIVELRIILGKSTIIERWIRKLPKDKWNDKLETKLCSLSPEYATNHDREIFWVSAMNKIDTGLQHKLVWKLHIDRTMNITKYNEICLLETMDKVISDEEFYNTNNINKY
jgi:hypothetical protein